MRVFVTSPPNLSQAMFRVARALARYAPAGVQVVAKQERADVVLLHTIGYPETVEAMERLRARGQKAIIAQYCLRSTQEPKVDKWLPLWREAAMVWSYYDLPLLCLEDGHEDWGFNFCHTPLGADPDVFKPSRQPENRTFTIFTSGYVAETEGVHECAEAARRVGGKMFHLGPPNVAPFKHATWGLGIDDAILRLRYAQTKFVAGLRRVEGFELPAAEGLLCGARPVMFDRWHYRCWFGDFAYFVPEGSAAEVTDALTEVFRQGARPVTETERRWAVERFAWEGIVKEFWRRLA